MAIQATRAAAFALLLVAACSGSDGGSPPPAGDPQTPPADGAAMEAWLHTGAYKRWHCEGAIESNRAPSPHGLRRICSNDALAGATGSEGPWPIGAAAVLETYYLATDTTPAGYAVYVKHQPESAGGGGWYWYARVPTKSTLLPHDAAGIAADGFGGIGAAHSVCVGCHSSAGMDADHTPSTGGHDLVFTPVL